MHPAEIVLSNAAPDNSWLHLVHSWPLQIQYKQDHRLLQSHWKLCFHSVLGRTQRLRQQHMLGQTSYGVAQALAPVHTLVIFVTDTNYMDSGGALIWCYRSNVCYRRGCSETQSEVLSLAAAAFQVGGWELQVLWEGEYSIVKAVGGRDTCSVPVLGYCSLVDWPHFTWTRWRQWGTACGGGWGISFWLHSLNCVKFEPWH